MRGFGVVAVIALVLAGAAAFAMRSWAPNEESRAANAAFTDANNTMMAGLMGKSVVYTGDPDLDFVTLMIPHHRGAIDMAGVELKYGKDARIKAMAEQVIADQKSEIDLMEAWSKTHNPAPATDPSVVKTAYVEANSRVMDAMGGHAGGGHQHGGGLTGDPDLDFVTMMVPHHQGALDLAEVQLKYGKDPAIRALSEQIIAAQKKEIAEMNAWLRARGK